MAASESNSPSQMRVSVNALTEWLSRTVAFPLADRDGPARVPLLRELEESQWLPASVVTERQRKKLVRILRHALTTVPFYRDSARFVPRPDNDEELLRAFASWPILTKVSVQEHRRDLLSSNVPASALRTAKTGGSTGTSLTVHFDRDCEAHRVAAAWRSDGWAGWRLGAARAALWGSPPIPTTWRQHLRSALLDRTLYLDTLHLTDASIRAFFDEYQHRRPPVLFGHSHSLYVLARRLEDMALSPAPPVGIISTSMMLMSHERAAIERVFAASVFNRYGCEEVGLIASECSRHSGLHVNVDHLVVELIDEQGNPTPPGTTGRVILTDLLNRGMPMIRYEVGDLAVWSETSCPCGRGSPTFSHVVGRTADFLIREDGGLVAGVSLVEKTLTALPGLLQMQIEQNELRSLEVRIVVSGTFDENGEHRLREELAAAFGSAMTFRITRVGAIAPTGRGKYRFAICNIRPTGR